MDEAAQEGSRRQHDGPCPQFAAVREPKPSDSASGDREVLGLGFDHDQTGSPALDLKRKIPLPRRHRGGDRSRRQPGLYQ